MLPECTKSSRELTRHVTRSTFGELSVTANWRPTLTYEVDGHRIAPGGFLAQTDDGNVLAGVFAGFFNGTLLAAGEHYLIVERTPHVVTVRQPVGTDTGLTIDGPADWQPGEALRLWVFDRDGRRLGEAGFRTEGGRVKFVYSQIWDGQLVGRYEIHKMP